MPGIRAESFDPRHRVTGLRPLQETRASASGVDYRIERCSNVPEARVTIMMLFQPLQPHQKRSTFRPALKSGKLLRFPGAFSPLVAMLIEQIGFDGIYISGAVLSADLGLPDIGLTTLPEV